MNQKIVRIVADIVVDQDKLDETNAKRIASGRAEKHAIDEIDERIIGAFTLCEFAVVGALAAEYV